LREPSGAQGRNKKPTWVIQYQLPAKIEQLLRSLCEIRDGLKGGIEPYALSLELEPGSAYVLSDHTSLMQVYDAIQTNGLAEKVGLNLDIAHFKIAGISPAFLKGGMENNVQGKDLTHWLVHSHIADHPLRMHTRDLALSAYTDLEGVSSDFCAYLDLLMDRAKHFQANRTGLLFSGAVAVELEGCSRMSWIHNSIPQLKKLLRAAARRCNR
jgi:hypothetical protein